MATLLRKIEKNLFFQRIPLTNATTIGKNRMMMNCSDRLYSIDVNATRMAAANKSWTRPQFLPPQSLPSAKPFSLLVQQIGQQRRTLTIQSALVARNGRNMNSPFITSSTNNIASTVGPANFQFVSNMLPVRLHSSKPLPWPVFYINFHCSYNIQC